MAIGLALNFQKCLVLLVTISFFILITKIVQEVVDSLLITDIITEMKRLSIDSHTKKAQYGYRDQALSSV